MSDFNELNVFKSKNTEKIISKKELKTKVAALEEDNERLRGELDELKKRIKELEDVNKKYFDYYRTLEKELSVKKITYKESQELLIQANNNYVKLKKEINNLRSGRVKIAINIGYRSFYVIDISTFSGRSSLEPKEKLIFISKNYFDNAEVNNYNDNYVFYHYYNEHFLNYYRYRWEKVDEYTINAYYEDYFTREIRVVSGIKIMTKDQVS